MAIAPLSLKNDYWQNFEVKENDLQFLYSYLLDVEKPQNTQELLGALIDERIREEIISLKKQQMAGGPVYYPKDHYQVGQTIQIPALNWQSGKVTAARPGQNPEMAAFEVIEVALENGETRQFAAGLEEHKLNQPVSINADDPLLNRDNVLENYGEMLTERLSDILENNPDLVRIAAMWFPRALLVDINGGQLNMAEAVLDMLAGGPLSTPGLMDQIDLPEDAGGKLNEFSLNLALQEDKRFDEVGPSGEVLWFLHRMEPEPVRETPVYLRYYKDSHLVDTSLTEDVNTMLQQLGPQVVDELEQNLHPLIGKPPIEVTLSLIYPHLRAGTLPLIGTLSKLFPTAFESPRIQFTFVDGNSGEKFSGWVVRPNHYVYGLREWYLSQSLIAGSLIHVRRGKIPGEMIIRADKKRATREWLRTAIVASDGGVVFSMLKHNLAAAVDERMSIVVSDAALLDKIWDRQLKQRVPLAQTVRQVMGVLAKQSPQNHVHAEELYAGVNILRRCPPGPILSLLQESAWAKHLGNLYFRLEDTSGGDKA